MTTVRAVLFDLDDTLFAQADWLTGAWRAAAAAAPAGVDTERLHRTLLDVAAEGSDRGRIIDRALEAVGAGDADVTPLVEAFRRHRPTALAAFPGALEGVALIRERVPVGLVTDGDVSIQAAKLAALGLDPAFDVVVMSDHLGREFRKPHPAPFLAALAALRVDPAHAVFVGDRPGKDVDGAQAVGMRAVRVRTGEYAATSGGAEPWAEAADVAGAVDLLLPLLPRSPLLPRLGDDRTAAAY